MTDPSQFGGNKPQASAGALDCATVESWLTEAAEENLSPVDAAKLRAHLAGCAACTARLTQARRGREWLLILKLEPLEPPADLVARILLNTLGAADEEATLADRAGMGRLFGGLSLPGHATDFPLDPKLDQGFDRKASEAGQPASSVPSWQHTSVVVLRRTLLEPRLALVAAMAFFSVSLTLNLMGVRLTKMRPADLEPQNMRRAVTRQYAEANARVVRYYENLRIVYEVESRVHQLRRAAETNTPPQQSSGKPHQGSSDSSNDQKESHRGDRMAANPDTRPTRRGAPAEPQPIFAGPLLEAALDIQSRRSSVLNDRAAAAALATQLAPQASSCPLTSILYVRERRLA